MKNLIVGTAGHVDHGKTCLIKALTGKDTDRLKEEKERGITIENGFADMYCGEYHISIIDVPGHERFVKNMLMGIGGIDFVLLVIGLDEGVMPQTREHFQILDMLDIKKGIMVYTKKDLVDDEEWIELVKEDARAMVKGSFLEGAPEIEVSAYTGENIEKLKEMILSCIEDGKLKNYQDELFRLPVDRVFTISGFGTVVTGTLLEGTVRTGDEVQIYPGSQTAKIRNVQVHNEQTECAYAGQRTALNLGGIKKEEIVRGTVLARKGAMKPTKMLDVKLRIFSDADRAVLNHSRVHFYCGSTETLAKVVLLDRDAVEKGDACMAQLRLEEEIVAKYADRFIIRFYSPLITIGGGKILEVNPVKHKRFDAQALENLNKKDTGSRKDLCEILIYEQSGNFIDIDTLSQKMNIGKAELMPVLHTLEDEKLIKITSKENLLHTAYLNQAADLCMDLLREYHAKNQMSQGMQKEELKSRLQHKMKTENRKIIENVLSDMEQNGLIRLTQNLIAAADFSVKLSPAMQALKEEILKQYEAGKYEMPSLDEILENKKDKVNARHIIEAMDGQELARLNHQYYISKTALLEARVKMERYIAENGQITLAEFRDMLETSRKYAVTILEYFDEQKITRKVDDARVLM